MHHFDLLFTTEKYAAFQVKRTRRGSCLLTSRRKESDFNLYVSERDCLRSKMRYSGSKLLAGFRANTELHVVCTYILKSNKSLIFDTFVFDGHKIFALLL